MSNNIRTFMARALLQGLMTFGLTMSMQVHAYEGEDVPPAVVPGITGSDFTFTAGTANIGTPDGDSLHIWAFGEGTSAVQYPGPTLILQQGVEVTLTLTNTLPVPTSIMFPGMGSVAGSGGSDGLLAHEAAAGQSVTYTFTPEEPGTYMYQSGSDPELQIEMGLLGAIIVRPTGFDANNPTAYGAGTDTDYDHEYLFLLTEMDPVIHDLVQFGFPQFIDHAAADPKFWFINGRNGMDTLDVNDAATLPNQPYGSLARTNPNKKVLLRMIGGGRDQHAFHPHGNHSVLVARDGRMLTSQPDAETPTPDLATQDFTFTPTPGGTLDAIFQWSSKGLGWHIYGTQDVFPHDCTPAAGDTVDALSGEDCTYHNVAVTDKVTLPGIQDLSFGGWYSGSPFMGQFGTLPPGEGGLNLAGGLFFMWHSHNEKELTNFDVFPGGMLTFVVIEPPVLPSNGGNE